MKLYDVFITEEMIASIEAEALLILEEVDEDGFEKATSKYPHHSAVNAWSKRDNIDPKEAMKIWDNTWESSPVKAIPYVFKIWVNKYKAIDKVNAAKVKARLVTTKKTNTHTKAPIEDIVKNSEIDANPTKKAAKVEEKKDAKAVKKDKLTIKKLTAEISRLKAQNSTPTREAKIKALWAERKQLNASLK